MRCFFHLEPVVDRRKQRHTADHIAGIRSQSTRHGEGGDRVRQGVLSPLGKKSAIRDAFPEKGKVDTFRVLIPFCDLTVGLRIKTI